MKSEKRRYTRFNFKDNVYAALGTHFSRVGRIKNISVDGLAFEYIENTKNSELDSSVVSIFHSENGFLLPHIDCKLIYDHTICQTIKQSTFKKRYSIKRCGILFIAINSVQMKKLNFFIDNYSRGIMSPAEELKVSS
jgi:hypothetical protein